MSFPLIVTTGLSTVAARKFDTSSTITTVEMLILMTTVLLFWTCVQPLIHPVLLGTE